MELEFELAKSLVVSVFTSHDFCFQNVDDPLLHTPE